jgi:GNAT superfamily N-acetyltransferase
VDVTVEYEVRQAHKADHEAVAAFTRDTWEERGGGDYIPRVFEEWVETDGPRQRTLVADVVGEDDPGKAIAGVVQGVLLSDHEAWGQGIRVNPDYRGQGVGTEMTHAVFDWAREGGATVVRNMVFSWNGAGLGQSRAVGYRPATEFRWIHPEPDPDGLGSRPDLADSPASVTGDPTAAWSFWRDSDACEHLRGLGLSTEETWALSELTRGDLERLADDTAVFAVESPRGLRGMAYRTRTYDRENDDGDTETWAEYGVGAWSDLAGAHELCSAVARDAADLGADRTRVLVPETAQAVTDAAFLELDFSEEPDFVLAADLTADYREGSHLDGQ